MSKIADKIANEMSDNYNQQIDEKLFRLSQNDFQESEKVGYDNYSYWKSTMRVFLKRKVVIFFLALLGIMLLFTCLQPLLPNQYNPNEINIDVKTGLQDDNHTPDSIHWFGTNKIGQDLWARIWSGCRTSLLLGISITAINIVIGIIIGCIWGFVRKAEGIILTIYNILSNIPQVVILILMSYILKPGVATMVVAMTITGWLGMALFIRNQILIIRNREYNLASKCLGTPTSRIITKNLLPFLVSVIVMEAAIMIPGVIGSELFLSFVALGLPHSIPSLGNLVVAGRDIIMSPDLRYQLLYPSIITATITISFYILGNNFADASDPKNHR